MAKSWAALPVFLGVLNLVSPQPVLAQVPIAEAVRCEAALKHSETKGSEATASLIYQGSALRSHSILLGQPTISEVEDLRSLRTPLLKELDLSSWDRIDFSMYGENKRRVIVTLLHQAGFSVLARETSIFFFPDSKRGPERQRINELVAAKVSLEVWADFLTAFAPDPAGLVLHDWIPNGGTRPFTGSVEKLIQENRFLPHGNHNLNWFLIGRVNGLDSRSELQKDFPNSETVMETFWPTTEATGPGGTIKTITIAASGIRVRRNLVDGKAREVESFVFVDGRWMPLLYVLDQKTEKWIRRFETNRGEPIWKACIKCHGSGADFGPAVKLNRYDPADWTFGMANRQLFPDRPRDISLGFKLKDPLAPKFLNRSGFAVGF